MTDPDFIMLDSDEDLDIEHVAADIEFDSDSDESATEVSNVSALPYVAGSSVNHTVNSRPDSSDLLVAITYNKITTEKLKKLEMLLQQRLVECRQKLNDVSTNGNIAYKEKPRKKTFRFLQCGVPYFKDKDQFPPPLNKETLFMKQSNMFDHCCLSVMIGWSSKDKKVFCYTLQCMSRNMKQKKLLPQVEELENNKHEDKNSEHKLLKLRNELKRIEKMSLAELALPIDEDYDWERVAEKLRYRHFPHECKALWKVYLHPSINKEPWSDNEKDMLQEITKNCSTFDWDEVAKKLNTRRTGYQCFIFYRTKINLGRTCAVWTKEEDECLLRLVNRFNYENTVSWSHITQMMENRTKSQVYARWTQLCNLATKKGRFVSEEDSVLLTCINKFGEDFNKVSKYMAGRNSRQLKCRYNVLKRRSSVYWTVEEDTRLFALTIAPNNEGKHPAMADIVHLFPGKRRCNLRMRYKTLLSWVAKNTNLDFNLAPRRSVYRLFHGKPTDQLESALHTLNRKYENNREKAINYDMEIIKYLHEEHMQDLRQSKEAVPCTELLGRNEAGLTALKNVQNIQVFLRAKLDKATIMTSSYSNLYLENIHSADVITPKVRCYSRKKVTPPAVGNLPDIWGGNLLGEVNYVFPPNFHTLVACRFFLREFNTHNEHYSKLISFSTTEKLQEWRKLLDRFRILFMWPLRLSYKLPLKPQRLLLLEKEKDRDTANANQT